MGESFVRGLRNSKKLSSIAVAEIDNQRKIYLSKTFGLQVSSEESIHLQLKELVPKSDIVAFCIKPQNFKSVSDSIRGIINNTHLTMSIMAGINLNKICNSLNLQNAVRIMPNTPSQIGKGISVWVSKNSLKPSEEVMVAHILDSLGVSIKTLEEEDIDKATAVSGSGPGFLFLIMETMYKTAKEIGLNDEMSKALISQTILGSGELAVYSKKSFAELKNEVISPLGTTEAGINAMMSNGIEKAISEGIKKAFRRSQELNDS